MAPELTPADTTDAAVMDDLEKYMALPAEANLDLDVLAWWKERDHNKPADPASGRPACHIPRAATSPYPHGGVHPLSERRNQKTFILFVEPP